MMGAKRKHTAGTKKKMAKARAQAAARRRAHVPPEAEALTVDQTGIVLQLGKVTIFKMLKDGRLEGVLFGRSRRVTRRSIDALLAG